MWFAILSNNSQRGTIYSQEYCGARTITVAGTRLTKGLLTANLDQIKTQQLWITNIVFHICQDNHLWQTMSKMDETTRIEFSIFYNLLHYETLNCTYNECKCHCISCIPYYIRYVVLWNGSILLRNINILVNNELKELISHKPFSILFLLPSFE